MSAVETAAGKAQAMVRDSVKTVIAASMVGTAIEFYDFYAYGTAAANYFPKVFFGDTANPTVALLASLLTFAIAFIAARWARWCSAISVTVWDVRPRWWSLCSPWALQPF